MTKINNDPKSSSLWQEEGEEGEGQASEGKLNGGSVKLHHPDPVIASQLDNKEGDRDVKGIKNRSVSKHDPGGGKRPEPLMTLLRTHSVISGRIPSDTPAKREGKSVMFSNDGILPALPAYKEEGDPVKGGTKVSEYFVFSEPKILPGGQDSDSQLSGKNRSVGTMPLVFIGELSDLTALMAGDREILIENKIELHNQDMARPIYASLEPYRNPKFQRKVTPVLDTVKMLVNGVTNLGVRTEAGSGSIQGKLGKGGAALLTRLAKVVGTTTSLRKKGGKEEADNRFMLKISYLPEDGMDFVGENAVSFRSIGEKLMGIESSSSMSQRSDVEEDTYSVSTDSGISSAGSQESLDSLDLDSMNDENES